MKMQIRSEQGCHLYEWDGHYISTAHQGEAVEVLAQGGEEEEKEYPLESPEKLTPEDVVLIRTSSSQGWVTWGELAPVPASWANPFPN